MVKITFYQSSDGYLTGFDCRDHAGYSDEEDIVCSAVSALTINCINSVEKLTCARFNCDSSEGEAHISFSLKDFADASAQLLLKSLSLGLQDIESNYEGYIDLIFEEV